MDERELHQRARLLFEQVADLPAAAREAALARAEGEPEGAPVVAKVRGLLAADATPAPEGPVDPDALLGRELRDYELVEVIDAGGMGVVYRGRRQDPPEDVAIKVLAAGLASAEAVERFETEVELLASCRHEGIVRYRDSGRTKDGRPYLIMDLVDGPPLSTRDPAVRAGVTETVELAARAAAAVQHLHGRPATHRDLKPANILVRRGPDGAQPILIDLGIARRMDEPAGRGLTRGRVLGTPAYMSPEQAGGKPVDVTTDVYGLGAVLYELLTGHPPRRLDEVAPGDLDEERRRLAAPAAPPSGCVDAEVFGDAAAARRARAIRGDLDAVVLRSIESDPADRYASVEALRADLRSWLARRPVEARRIGPLGRAWRLARRSPLRTALGVGLLLFLSVTSFVTWRSLVEVRRAKRGLEEQLGTTAAIRDFIVQDVFQQASPELQGPETPVREIVRTAAAGIGPALDDRPAVAVGLRGTLISVLSTMGDLEGAREQLALTRPLAEKLPRTHPQRMEFDVEVGVLAEHEGRAAEAVEGLRDVVARIRAAEHAPPTLLPRGLTALGLALYGCNELEEARALHEEALDVLPAGDPSRWSLLSNVILIVSALDGPAAALPRQEELLAALRERFPPQHFYVMAQASNLASTYLDLGRPGDARPFAREALTIADATFEPDDLTRLIVLNNFASCLSGVQDFEQAVSLRREVLERRRRVLGDDNATVARAATNLATTLVRAERHAEALEPVRFAVKTLEALGQGERPLAASAYRTLGNALGGTGELADALAAFDRALAILESAEGDHAADLAAARAERRAVVAAESD